MKIIKYIDSIENWKLNKINKTNKSIEKGSSYIKIRVLGFPNLADHEKSPFHINDMMPKKIYKSIIVHKSGDSFRPGIWTVVSEPEVFVGLGLGLSWGDIFHLDSSVKGFGEKIGV